MKGKMNSKEDVERIRHILSMKVIEHTNLDNVLQKIIDSGWIETKENLGSVRCPETCDSGWIETEEGKEAYKKWSNNHEIYELD